MTGESWLADRLDEGPVELAARARDILRMVRGDRPLPERLGQASRVALDRAMEGGRDRRAALDLLAADTLVTLALAAQVDLDPAGLAEFARRLRRASEAPV